MPTTGTASLNFGAAPGAFEASVAVSGQAGILVGSALEAWVLPATTADHSIDEHIVDPPRVVAGNVVPGVGFTIYGFAPNQAPFPRVFAGRDGEHDGPATSQQACHYGAWNVGWVWV